jgi:hypothetical protein
VPIAIHVSYPNLPPIGEPAVTSFVEKMEEVCRKIQARMERVAGNEQATKESLIKPFFNALGYDTEDPDTWRPEYVSDFNGRRRAEKVDYAVIKGDVPVLFIEAKPFSNSEASLESRDGQLARYFNATQSVKVSIITNGVVFRFFSDIDVDNVQDKDPFYVFDARTAAKSDFEILEMFSPSRFDVEVIRTWADEHKNNLKVRDFLQSILTEPANNVDFVKFVLDQTDGGFKSKSVVESFSAKLPRLMKEAHDACIKVRLGLGDMEPGAQRAEPRAADAVVTTVEELNVFSAIRGLLVGAGKDATGVLYKDFPKWFNVSHRRGGNWFIRLYFNDNPRTMLVRLPFASSTAVMGTTDKMWQRAAGTVVQLDDDLDVAPWAKLIFEAFEQCVSGKQEGEGDDAEQEAA